MSDDHYVDRLERQFQSDRVKITAGLVGALRRVPPAQREQEAASAIRRLKKQERLENKIKTLPEDQIENLLKSLGD
ncbi:MAG: hypothetical protein WBF58_08830 [Xanthobacteraceae bacterium]